jgi:4-oxalocrotonate tautomerase
MPFVVAHIAKGRPLEKRRRLAVAITDAISEIFEIERSATQVIVVEHERDSWAIGGELLSERTPAKAPEFDLESLFRKAAAKPSPKPAAKAASRKPAAKPRSRR